MNPSQERKIVLTFRYQIQYTNQISDNDCFQLKSRPQNSFLKHEKNQNEWMNVQKMESRLQKAQIYNNSIGKQSPIIVIPNRHTHTNNVAKMQQQQQAIKYEIEDIQDVKMNNQNSTPKKSKQNNHSCLMTATSKDIKTLVQDERKGKNSRKGLAWISQHILYLLEGEYGEQKKFTCGQISQKVLTDFYSKSRQEISDNNIEQKEKKTIRRRVYDSINVLIALGKIKKDHKFLYAESIDRKMGEEIISLKKQKLGQLKRETQRKQMLLSKAKAEHSKLLQLKLRNQQLSQSVSLQLITQKQQGYSGTFSTFSPSQTIYRFPLLFIYGQNNSKMTIEYGQKQQEKGRDEIIIGLEPLYLLSDLSSLQYLNFSQSKCHSKRKNSMRNAK